MQRNTQADIEINVAILGGKPVIRGTRIPVYLILNLFGHGYTIERIIAAYPQLTKDTITAALQFAENITKYEEEFLVPTLAHA